MEMEMEVTEEAASTTLLERLDAATARLEEAAERLAERRVSLDAVSNGAGAREAELEGLLAAAEATIASLRSARKTQPGGAGTLLAKEVVALDAGALDSALRSLSIEQRIAVKAGLLRSGMLA